MPVYITLFKWTDAGLRNISEMPDRIAESRKAAEALGGKVLGLYATMGEYDLISVIEWPDDEAAAATALAISSRGNARTETMRAFTDAKCGLR